MHLLWISWESVSETFLCLFFVCFWGPHLWHMEVPRLRVNSELQPPAYATATATQDLSRICNSHHSSWQCRILDPLSEARDRTYNLMVTSWICFCCATAGTPHLVFCSACTNLQSHQQFTKVLSFSTSLPTLVTCLFDDSHSDRCEVVSHCGFDLHLPDD